MKCKTSMKRKYDNLIWSSKKIVSLALDNESKLATMKINTKIKSWIKVLFSTHQDLDLKIEHLRNYIY